MVAFWRLYVDESGIHDNSPVTTSAMTVARPTTWRKWTRDWNVRKAPIKVFHAVDCHNRDGEFAGWSRPQRDAFVKNLLPVIPLHGIAASVAGIRNNDLERILQEFPKFDRNVIHRYGVCFFFAAMKLFEQWDRLEIDDRVAIVHEDNDFKHEVTEAFDYIREYLNPRKRRLSPHFSPRVGASGC